MLYRSTAAAGAQRDRGIHQNTCTVCCALRDVRGMHRGRGLPENGVGAEKVMEAGVLLLLTSSPQQFLADGLQSLPGLLQVGGQHSAQKAASSSA